MKIYIFIQVRDSEESEINLYPHLFAFTDKKKLANKFKETRNMKLFLCKTEELDHHEYCEYAKKFSSYALKETMFITKDNENSKLVIHIVTTMKEEIDVFSKNDVVYEELGKCTFDASIFSDKYIKALYDLKYFGYYLFYKDKLIMHDKYMPTHFYDGCSEEVELLKYENLDQFEIFLYFFGHTLKLPK